MAKSTLDTFLTATPRRRLAMAKDDVYAEMLKAYLEPTAYAEYRRIAEQLDENHLGIQAPKNLIFIPGVMGSHLQSRTKGGTWWIDARTRRHIDDLRLAPNGEEDADPANQIIPSTTDPAYEPFLIAVLARDDFGHELFPYDWRKPLRLSTGALKSLILHLYAENGQQPVHLVAHSLGGLLVRATLMAHGSELWPKLGRIVFIGTPHYGAPAIAGYLKNHLWGFDLMALLGLYLSRETYRSLWGVLTLLPAPRGVYPGTRASDSALWVSEDPADPYGHPCANFDLYQAEQWVLALSSAQTAQLQTLLDHVAAFHQRLEATHQSLEQTLRDRMLMIAGVGFKTFFRLAYKQRFFGRWEQAAKITARVKGDPHREGDGRVPLASAQLQNISIRYVKGIHGDLTNIPAVYHDVFHWLNGERLRLPDNVPEALSMHLAPDEGTSAAPHLDGTARAIPFTDDPGLWNLKPPEPAHLEALKMKLEAEHLPAFTRVRIL